MTERKKLNGSCSEKENTAQKHTSTWDETQWCNHEAFSKNQLYANWRKHGSRIKIVAPKKASYGHFQSEPSNRQVANTTLQQTSSWNTIIYKYLIMYHQIVRTLILSKQWAKKCNPIIFPTLNFETSSSLTKRQNPHKITIRKLFAFIRIIFNDKSIIKLCTLISSLADLMPKSYLEN